MSVYDNIVSSHQGWIDSVWEKLQKKMPYAVEKAQGLSFIPYTVKDGEWQEGPMDGICWWTNGFWPGLCWQMYLATKDERYRLEAVRGETMLDEAFNEFDHLHHDLGFMWLISSGVHYRLTGNDLSRKRTLLAANLLAGRYNPNGFIRAWNTDRTGWAIIDCMMNLNLLYFAAEHTKDPRFSQIAVNHADTVLAHFVRADGSVEHIVVFDPETGAVVDKLGGQGIAPGSAWSRGQGWAVYGFVLSYLHTGLVRYLDAAKRIAHFFIANVQDDWLPDCDFRAPKAPAVKDDCAGGLTACALIELAKIVPENEKAFYLNAAIAMLRAMDERHADYSRRSPAILTHCTGAYHGSDHHIAMVYGDYYFVEAMNKLRGETMLFW